MFLLFLLKNIHCVLIDEAVLTSAKSKIGLPLYTPFLLHRIGVQWVWFSWTYFPDVSFVCLFVCIEA